MPTSTAAGKLPTTKQMLSRSLSDHEYALARVSAFGFAGRPGFGGCSRTVLSTLYRWRVIEYTGDRNRPCRLSVRGKELLAAYIERDPSLAKMIASRI